VLGYLERAMELHDRRAPSDCEDPIELPSADAFDPVVEAYKKDVDRTVREENLKLTTEERPRYCEPAMAMVYKLRRAGAQPRVPSSKTE